MIFKKKLHKNYSIKSEVKLFNKIKNIWLKELAVSNKCGEALFVIEDNNLSVHTPTDKAWKVKQEIPNDIAYYRYVMGYPHHGTGAWVNF